MRGRRRGAVWLPLLLCSAVRVGSATPPPALIPLEQLYGSKVRVLDARLSPDGRWIAFRRLDGGAFNLFIRRWGSSEERAVTRNREQPVGFFEWSRDGRYLFFLQDNAGDEFHHVWVATITPTGPGQASDVTRLLGVSAEFVAVSDAREHEILVTLNKRDPRLADAYWLDLESGAVRLAAENPGNVLGYLADRSGRVRVAYAVDPSGRYSILTRLDETSKWKTLVSYESDDSLELLRFHPDGRRIYIKSSAGRNLAALALLDLATGRQTVVDQDPLGRADLETAFFRASDGRLLATSYFGDRLVSYPKKNGMGRLLEGCRRLGNGNVHLLSSTRDGLRWIVSFDAPTVPEDIYGVDLRDGKPELLFRSRPGLDGVTLADSQPISFRARDGLRISGYLTLPLGVGPKGLPLVLLVHGGPWDRDRWVFNEDVQMLANRGYAVLQVNYRGSTGFGKSFAAKARHEFAGRMHQDVLDAVDWAVARGFADRKRVGIFGGSYGGYETLVALALSPEVFACGIDLAGPASLVTLIEAFPPDWAPFLPRRWYPYVGNPSDHEQRADLERRSPVNLADHIRAPLLVFQGANDPRVRRDQSDRIVQAVMAHGVPVTYLVAENEGHAIDDPENSVAVNRAIELFLAAALRGRAQLAVSEAVEARLKALTANVGPAVAQ